MMRLPKVTSRAFWRGFWEGFTLSWPGLSPWIGAAKDVAILTALGALLFLGLVGAME